jgi:hypothetical protein
MVPETVTSVSGELVIRALPHAPANNHARSLEGPSHEHRHPIPSKVRGGPRLPGPRNPGMTPDVQHALSASDPRARYLKAVAFTEIETSSSRCR